MGKEPQKPLPKLQNMYIIYVLRTGFCMQSNGSGRFLQTCINLVEKRLKFSHFEGSIIP